MSSSAVVCGLERLGLRVAEALIRLGEQVTIVGESPDPLYLREARSAGARFVQGRSLDLAHLQRTGLESARCLVLTDNSDLGNLHAALAARDVNPRLRVVIRMFNADLADRATRLLSNSRVISSSFEAAPHFAAAARGVSTAPTRLVWGRHFQFDPEYAAAMADRHGGRWRRPLQDLRSGRLALTRSRLSRADASPLEQPVDLGGGQVLAPLEAADTPIHHRRRRRRRLIRALRAFLDRRLAVTLTAITLVTGVTIVVFHTFIHLAWIDALYFTVTTAATVGYGDFNLQYAPWWIKLYGVGFMIVAALGLAVLYALVVDAVVGARILEALGVPRGRLRQHVVVIGVGSVGYRIIQHLLDAGVEVAAAEISDRSRFVPLARRQGVPVLIADGRYSDSMRALSVEGASAVVAATDDDLANLETALTARDLNPNARIVARLYNQELADRAQRQFGIDACHSVSALATPAFVAAALGDGVLSTLERGQRLWLLAELNVQPDSLADGSTVDSLKQRRDLLVLAMRHAADEYWGKYPATLKAGDDLLVACSRESWEELRRLVASPTEL